MTLSPTPPVRIGVLGCGTIAYWAHLRTLRRLPGAALVAAADPDPAARARATRLTGVSSCERAGDVLRRDDVDAVVVSAPTPFHADLAVAAAGAGKHFYLEKPMATTAEEARRVMTAAREAGVIAALGFNFRRNPAHERARALLMKGRIGAVRAVQTAFCEPAPGDVMPVWKRRRNTGGGVLLDLGSHHLDLLRWFLNDDIAAVEARVDSESTEHDVARVTLATRRGVEVQSYFSFRAGPADFLEFIGERGTLRVDRFGGTVTLRVGRRFGYGVRRVWVAPTAGMALLRVRRLARPSYEPSFRRTLAAFVERLRGGPGPVPSLDDGAHSLAAVLAAEESALTGTPVVVGAV